MARKKPSKVSDQYALVKKFPDGWYYRLGSSSSSPWLGPFQTQHVAERVREHATGGPWGMPRNTGAASRGVVKSPHATKKQPKVHLLKTRGGTACGEPGKSSADINRVTCAKCLRAHEAAQSHATMKAPSASKNFHAVEFDLAKGERTGLVMEFVAEDMQEAAQHLVYTLNLKSKGWKVSPSGKTVQKMTGDIGWHLVRAGTPAASRMGLD